MLSPKEILQIDATVLAGIFILITIISIEEEDTTFQDLEKELAELVKKIDVGVTNLMLEIQQKELKLSDKEQELKQKELELGQVLSDEEIQKQMDELKDQINELEFKKAENSDEPDLPDKSDLEDRWDDLFLMLQEGEQARRQPYLDSINSTELEISSIKEEINFAKQTRTELIKRSTPQLESIKAIISEKIKEKSQEEIDFFLTPKVLVYLIGIPFAASAFIATIAGLREMDNKMRQSENLTALALGASAVGFATMVVVFSYIGLS